jgi:hypothetical protein
MGAKGWGSCRRRSLNGCEGLGELNPIAGTLWMFHAKSLFVLFGFFMVDNCVP